MTEPDPWLVAAERMDRFRLIPRLLIIAYYLYFAWAWIYVVDWFMAYDWAAVTSQAVALALAAFPAAILGVLTSVLGKLTDFYFKSDKDMRDDRRAAGGKGK